VTKLPLAALVMCSIGLGGLPDADACATAPPHGEEVQIAEEEAVIVWDPATHTEHFIRRAAFHSTAHAFGFLVPTPTTPTLEDLPDSIYADLGWGIRPEVRHERGGLELSIGSLLFELFALSGRDKGVDTAAPAIRVIQTARVAGFDAITVEADDPVALTGWLGRNGFAASAELTAWLARYVTDHWKLTAFVISADVAQGQRHDVATRAVHMTFHTDRPFYPYREPAAPPARAAPATPGAEPRLLRVFFLSNARYAATLAGQPWAARVLHAAPIEHAPTPLIPLAGARPFATVFVDDSAPRRGSDELYFAPSADPAEVRQSVTVVDRNQIMIPVELILVVAFVAIRLVRRRRRHVRRGDSFNVIASNLRASYRATPSRLTARRPAPRGR
jgi:uncharacterized protein DUF2330